MWVSAIGRKIGERIRLNNQHNLDLALVLTEHRVERVNVRGLVLSQSSTAVACCIIITSSVRVIGAANFSI
jgi:hypothetical protein